MTNVNSVCIKRKKKLANLLKENLCKSITKFIKMFDPYNFLALLKTVSSSTHEIKRVLLVPFMSRFRGGGVGPPPPSLENSNFYKFYIEKLPKL